MELAYEALLTKGHPSHIHVASIIASKQAIEYLQRKMPDDTKVIRHDIRKPAAGSYDE